MAARRLPLAQGRPALGAYAQWTKTVPDPLTSRCGSCSIARRPPSGTLRGASAVHLSATTGARRK